MMPFRRWSVVKVIGSALQRRAIYSFVGSRLQRFEQDNRTWPVNGHTFSLVAKGVLLLTVWPLSTGGGAAEVFGASGTSEVLSLQALEYLRSAEKF